MNQPPDLSTVSVTSPQPVSVETLPYLRVSERALAKITAERVKRQQPGLLFRITVSGGGCSGLHYKFGYDDQPFGDDDRLFPEGLYPDNTRVVTDDVSLRFLNGATLDYEQDLMGARFAIKNPNAVSGCGCGVSFSVDFGKL